MADIIQKCISENNVREGSATAGVSQAGNKQVLRRTNEKTISIQRIEDKLTNRLDETTYYTA